MIIFVNIMDLAASYRFKLLFLFLSFIAKAETLGKKDLLKVNTFQSPSPTKGLGSMEDAIIPLSPKSPMHAA